MAVVKSSCLTYDYNLLGFTSEVFFNLLAGEPVWGRSEGEPVKTGPIQNPSEKAKFFRNTREDDVSPAHLYLSLVDGLLECVRDLLTALNLMALASTFSFLLYRKDSCG